MAEIRLLIDENISWRLKRLLVAWEVLPANEIPTMKKITDNVIWQYAKDNHYQLLTFDEDFVELHNLYGYPPKVIWLRMGNVSTQDIANRLNQLTETLLKFILEDEAGVIEIY